MPVRIVTRRGVSPAPPVLSLGAAGERALQSLASIRRRGALALAAFSLCSTCLAQQPLRPSSALIDTRGQAYFVNAKPYIDDALPRLKKAVHELRGLHPAAGQKPLEMILSQTGARLEDLAGKLPNLIALENVDQFQAREDGSGAARIRNKYNYLILVHQNGSRPDFQERRVDLKGRRPRAAGLEEGFVVTKGFATLWRDFLPSVQRESVFRYLGTARINKKPVYVVGFAQRPGWVDSPMYFVENQHATPCLFQGVAWIDESSFRILRLRTDLLAPRKDVGLKKMTTVVTFGPARIAQVPEPLWLPVKAEVTAGIGGYFYRNIHRYSNYKLFRTRVRFLPPPGKPVNPVRP